MKVIETGYRPRKLQAEIHRSLKRFSVLVCHRRFGKTVACINELIDRAIRDQKERPRYGYIAPFYKQAKAVAWDYLKAYTKEIPGVERSETELSVTLPGDRKIRLFGADNPDALRGLYFDGVVLDEYAQMSPRLWGEIVRPALADRRGWAVFIGTPMGHNGFWAMYEFARTGIMPDTEGRKAQAGHHDEWLAKVYRASETGVLDPSELADMKSVLSDDEYAQELECSFEAAIKGAYYGVLMRQAQDEGKITRVPHDPSVRVETWWDLGFTDATAIWFVQRVGREFHIIDYYENSGEAIEHYANVLQDKSAPKDRGGRGFTYSRHVVPHDARAKRLETGKSIQELLEALGISPEICPQHDLNAGIDRARQIIPLCWFDETHCRLGIEALRQYRKEWDEDRKTFKRKPLHDWASHGADAFRYGSIYEQTDSSFHKPIDWDSYQPKGAYV